MRERDLVEERRCVIAQTGDRFVDFRPVVRLFDRPRAGDFLDVARELLEPVVAHAEAEMLSGDVLELMRFVDDRAAARGDDLAVRVLPNGRVRAQKVVVDDDDVGFRGALAHAGDETVVVAGTLGAQTRVGGCRDLVPERYILG